MRLNLDWIAIPLKRLTPTTLFARALLILVIPTVLVQLFTAYVFFERHWDNVTRHMATALAGEVALLAHEYHNANEARQGAVEGFAARMMGIEMQLERGRLMEAPPANPQFKEFERQLKNRLTLPFMTARSADGEDILIGVQMKEGVLRLKVSIKRLASSTTTIFLLWMAGSAIILLLVATLFLRGQVRPIAMLAEAAENFGKGQESPSFRPAGALEVRRAARAFLVMKERIGRQIATRVEMLAGISHDLRTPLTRMKLQLALIEKQVDTSGLEADVTLMERMIQEYLDFARGAGKEETAPVSLTELLEAIVAPYQREGKPVQLHIAEDVTLYVRAHAFGRALTNLIDNALRYGTSCAIATRATPSQLAIHLDDEGPGIAEENRQIVFRPFTRLEPSRNQQTGGAGLGLTIARDIIVGHGGEIALSEAPKTRGLRVTVRLPL